MKRHAVTILSTIALFGAIFVLSGDNSQADTAKIAKKEKTAEKIQWLSYDEGLAKAKKEGKHILVDFYTNWCGWCKKMDKTTFADPEVVEYMNRKMVAIKVNAEAKTEVNFKDQVITEAQLSRQVYGVSGYPTYYFIDPDGKSLFKVPGYKRTAEFLNLARYVGDSYYKEQSFQAFVDAKKNGGKSSK